MIQLTEGAGQVIAADMVTVFHSTDDALLNSARLTVSVLEGTAQSGMHPRIKQKLLQSMSTGYGKILEGRKDMIDAHSQMIVIQRLSNIATVNYGCWGGPQKFFIDASASKTLTAVARQEA
ncbi:hypothetical protein [Allosphingosinicella vermicomposti]|uniref:hypothetical protein n=1 Tax=Allosphingosinicella vermicomposti TaxID=614671 RepID=UPI000D10AEAF|nr:hypothetical protein [Allosphingosinicella vermicomposti]